MVRGDTLRVLALLPRSAPTGEWSCVKPKRTKLIFRILIRWLPVRRPVLVRRKRRA